MSITVPNDFPNALHKSRLRQPNPVDATACAAPMFESSCLFCMCSVSNIHADSAI